MFWAKVSDRCGAVTAKSMAPKATLCSIKRWNSDFSRPQSGLNLGHFVTCGQAKCKTVNQIICFILSPCRFYGLDYSMQIIMKKMDYNVLPWGVKKCLDVGAFHFQVLSRPFAQTQALPSPSIFVFYRIYAQSEILRSHWQASLSTDQRLSFIPSTCLQTLLLFHVGTAACSKCLLKLVKFTPVT